MAFPDDPRNPAAPPMGGMALPPPVPAPPPAPGAPVGMPGMPAMPPPAAGMPPLAALGGGQPGGDMDAAGALPPDAIGDIPPPPLPPPTAPAVPLPTGVPAGMGAMGTTATKLGGLGEDDIAGLLSGMAAGLKSQQGGG